MFKIFQKYQMVVRIPWGDREWNKPCLDDEQGITNWLEILWWGYLASWPLTHCDPWLLASLTITVHSDSLSRVIWVSIPGSFQQDREVVVGETSLYQRPGGVLVSWLKVDDRTWARVLFTTRIQVLPEPSMRGKLDISPFQWIRFETGLCPCFARWWWVGILIVKFQSRSHLYPEAVVHTKLFLWKLELLGAPRPSS